MIATDKPTLHWDPETHTYVVDEAKADAVIAKQRQGVPAAETHKDRIRRVDELRRWGMGYQEACLMTAPPAELRDTPALQFAKMFIEGKGVGISDGEGEARQDAGGRKKTIAVFAGPLGVGKTTAAAYVLCHGRPMRITGPWTSHETPLFTHAEAILAASKLTPQSTADTAQRAQLKRCQILVIDDLGLEKDPRRTMQTYLDGLVNARYAGDGWLVITTNLPPGDFKKRYGDRIYDRLRQRACWYEISHESLREP